MKYILLLLTFFPLFLYADPWERATPPPSPSTCSTPILGPIAEKLIWLHQTWISPADGPRSHYLPSSSQYTWDAICRYGFFKGYLLGCDRLMRENSDPWVYERVPYGRDEELKYNPVP